MDRGEDTADSIIKVTFDAIANVCCNSQKF